VHWLSPLEGALYQIWLQNQKDECRLSAISAESPRSKALAGYRFASVSEMSVRLRFGPLARIMIASDENSMTTQNVKVAIIDNSIDPQVYNPVRHWSLYLDVYSRAFRPMEGEYPDWNSGFSHVIITGSEASILERDPWVEKEIELVREAVNRGLSILGSCYGHQVLAIALAGPSHVRKCRCPEIGWLPIEIIQDSDLLGKKRTVYAFSSHFDEVTGLGRDFQVLSRTEHCATQAFQWKGKPVWGLQYHPEMNPDEAQEYIRRSIEKGDKNSFHYRAGMESIPKDSGLVHRILERFFRETED